MSIDAMMRALERELFKAQPQLEQIIQRTCPEDVPLTDEEYRSTDRTYATV